MDLRSVQKPLKDKYRADADAALITIHAEASSTDTPIRCSLEVGRAIQEAYAHEGVGGGGGACSGDLLLGALAACAQITCQMVATAMQIETKNIRVHIDGDFDLRGTLGITQDAPVGFREIRLNFAIDAPNASEDQIHSLIEKTEKYCVVLQTILNPPRIVATRAGNG
jgi:uncharacterized OsmC-like protein